MSLGMHRPWFTLPLAAVLCALGWRAVRPREVPDATEARAARYGLAGVAAWVTVGLFFASEFLIVTRDPGFLALTGVWLIDHPSTDIPTLGSIDAAAGHSNMLADAWQAWNLSGDVVQPQGAKMLPGVLAVGGWIAGLPGVLAANIVIGGVGLMAVYLVARRLLGPMAALGPAALVGLSVAHLGLSRSPYSEPITLLLIIASVAWAWQGIEEGRIAPLVAAGVASGATALARIDGGAYALGVLVGVAAVALARGRSGRRPLLAFALAQAPMVGGGYLSLHLWSTAYLERLGGEALTLGLAYAAVVVMLLVASVIAGLGVTEALLDWLRGRREAFARVAAGAAVTTVVVLASRPLWMTDRRGTTSSTDKFTNSVVGAFQQREGYPSDPARSYAEHTITWLSYYLTWPVIALATVGLCVLAWRALASRPAILVLLGTLAVPTAIYSVRPAIVPDQLWAIRRFEPATLPLVAVAAGVGAWWIAAWVAERRPHLAKRATTVAAIVMVAAPVSTYLSIRLGDEHPVSGAVYAGNREQVGARAQIDDLCDVIDGRPVVLGDSAGYFGSIRVMCDVPVVLALVAPSPETLSDMALAWGEQPVVITQKPEWLWDEAPDPVIESTTYRGEFALQHMPRLVSPTSATWYAGIVEPDGTVTPLTPPE